MKTAPAFLAMLGDIISNGTKCFADISKNSKQALKEIDIFNECTEYLKPIPAKAVFRNKDGKFETFDFDLPSKKWKTPFEGLGIKASFNPLSPEYSEISDKGWFNSAKCIYFYPKEIEFRLDLSKTGKYSQAVLIAANLDGKRGETQFNVSADGKDWFALKPAGREKQFYLVFNLPEKIKNSPVLHFKFATGNVGASFGGIAVR